MGKIPNSIFFCVLIFFTSVISQVSLAQSEASSDLEILIQELDSTATAYSSVEYRFPSQNSIGKIESLFFTSEDSNESISAQLAEIEAEKNILRGDYGLDLQAGYLENFAAGFFGEEGIFYKRRAQVGLEWDILNNGLVENRYNIQKLENRKNALYSEANEAVPNEYFDILRNKVTYTFGLRKAEILESYLALLSQQEKILIALYHQNYVTWDEILNLTSEKARTDRLLRSTKELNEEFRVKGFKALDIDKLPLLQINLPMFADAAKKQRQSNAVSNTTVADYHPINDISLSASVDYNFFSSAPEESLTGVDNQREFISVGVNLSIPFPLQIKENNDLVEAKRQIIEEEALNKREGQSFKTYKIYEEYQSLLAEYERDYKSYQMHNEEIRKLRIKGQMEDPSYSPRELMEVLENRYNKMLELHNNHRTMYEKLLEAYELTYQGSVRRYVSPVEFTQSKQKQRVIPKYEWSIYVWSQTFEKYSNTDLVEYMNGQKFDTIFLSPGTNPDQKKVESFIQEAHYSGIAVEIMVGDNNLLLQSHQQEVMNHIAFAEEVGADGLHLDVEPQTFEDWDQKENMYKEQYVNMSEKAFEEAQEKGLTLSLSVPVYFDSIIEKLNANASSIQLMTYGTDDTQKIKSRTEEELKSAKSTISIALRPKDFKDLSAFKTAVEKLKSDLGINRFSVHDLEALLDIQDFKINNQ